jgi:hypothetical protein
MGLPSPLSLFRRLVMRRAVPREDDPADMGTEYGLEASLGPVSTYPDRAAPASRSADPGDDGPMGWLSRRRTRHR